MYTIRRYFREYKRLRRLLFPEPSVKRLIQVVGPWWLFFHGVKREHKIRLWSGKEWYSADLAIPKKKLIVEALGGVHYGNRRKDYIRTQHLEDNGWRVMEIWYEDMKHHPRKVRKAVRRFLGR